MKKHLKFLRAYYYRWKARRKIKEFIPPLNINYKCVFNSNTYLGKNANFNGIRIEGGGKVTIGDNFHSGKECLFITGFHNYDYGHAIPYDDTNINKDILIEHNVWLGTRVIVLGGVKIGEGAIIQAGAVVVDDIPKYGIAGGSPAKTFKFRNKEHYEMLKKAGKFK